MDQELKQEPILGVKYSFLSTIYYILLKANSKIHWDPEDLVTVGMMIRDLNSILEKYSNIKEPEIHKEEEVIKKEVSKKEIKKEVTKRVVKKKDESKS
tara:strand:- start:517 stop:810 length:294 start_codon:yes stop_codon:yes gene_type:complete